MLRLSSLLGEETEALRDETSFQGHTACNWLVAPWFKPGAFTFLDSELNCRNSISTLISFIAPFLTQCSTLMKNIQIPPFFFFFRDYLVFLNIWLGDIWLGTACFYICFCLILFSQRKVRFWSMYKKALLLNILSSSFKGLELSRSFTGGKKQQWPPQIEKGGTRQEMEGTVRTAPGRKERGWKERLFRFLNS